MTEASASADSIPDERLEHVMLGVARRMNALSRPEGYTSISYGDIENILTSVNCRSDNYYPALDSMNNKKILRNPYQCTSYELKTALATLEEKDYITKTVHRRSYLNYALTNSGQEWLKDWLQRKINSCAPEPSTSSQTPDAPPTPEISEATPPASRKRFPFTSL